MNTTVITTSRKDKGLKEPVSVLDFKNSEGRIVVQEKDLESKVLEKGPLESIFSGSESKILDFLIAFQEYDYSISDIAKNSGVGFKTTLGVIRKLELQNIILKERTVGRAQMYKLNLESEQAKSISSLSLNIATESAMEKK
ncbi:MAG TPA: hypothetical protein VMW74_03050 [Nitrosopumilaceae archaeon]|nr:hypothetical protein [Nitrosopumilaceae archaeon]